MRAAITADRDVREKKKKGMK